MPSGGILSAIVLVLALLTGGGSRDYGWGDAISQCVALLLLAWTAYAWLFAPTDRRGAWPWIGALLVIMVPLVQLLPLPQGLQHTALRTGLAADLAAAGLDRGRLPWGLSRHGAQQAALFLVPPLALWLAIPRLQERHVLGLCRAVAGVAVFSAVLGIVQLGAPQDSLLNPFPEWPAAFGGVFSNPNHQADLLLIGGLIALALGGRAWRHEQVRSQWLWAICGTALLACVPFTGSRAGLLIAVAATGAWFLLSGILARALHSDKRWPRLLVGAAALLTVLAVALAMRVMQTSVIDDSRDELRAATAQLAQANMPWGTGVGSFVRVFEQKGHVFPFESEYINHAHNEYLQWWLEAGVLALPAALCVLLGMGWALRRLLALEPLSSIRQLAAAGWIGVAALLAHSWVDFPLRTQALATLCAALAAVVLALLHRPADPVSAREAAHGHNGRVGRDGRTHGAGRDGSA